MRRDPFLDLHPKKVTAPRHIRLISEGGSSLAGSPGAVCLEPVQANQTCTTEPHHRDYRAATGACSPFSPPDNSLFTLASEHARELDKGSLPAVLRTRFEQQGIPLPDSAQVKVQHLGKVWYISAQDRMYSVRKRPACLTIYGAR